MGFRPCAHGDPFARRVREVYRANVVRAPKVGLDPYWVLAVREEQVDDRGQFAHLLAGPTTYSLPAPAAHKAADLTGLRSSTLDVAAGFGLTTGFLAALGVPSAEMATVSLKDQGVKQIAFEVHDVTELAIDLAALGAALEGAVIDRHNPAASIFFDDADVQMHLITRVLKARRFTLHALNRDGAAAKIETSGIAKAIADVNAAVSTASTDMGAVTFAGPHAATFAIATVPCNIDVTGHFSFGLPLGGLSFLGPEGGATELLVEHFPIVDDDGLLDLEVKERDAT